jgi:hypothetical protein
MGQQNIIDVTSNPKSTLEDLKTVFDEAILLSNPYSQAEGTCILRVLQHPSSDLSLFSQALEELSPHAGSGVALYFADNIIYREEIYKQALNGSTPCQSATVHGFFIIDSEMHFMFEDFAQWLDKKGITEPNMKLSDLSNEMVLNILQWDYKIFY